MTLADLDSRAWRRARVLRVQRQRTKGWRMPDNTIYIGRPSHWANPFKLAKAPSQKGGPKDMWAVTYRGETLIRWDTRQLAAADAVDRFRRHMSEIPGMSAAIRVELRGHNLCCWCPLDQPCHADVLLELANRGSA